MSQKRLFIEARNELFKRLEEKNSWGKNEAKTLILNVFVDILAEYAANPDLRSPTNHSIPTNLIPGKKYGSSTNEDVRKYPRTEQDSFKDLENIDPNDVI